jgi:hypothetical protein
MKELELKKKKEEKILEAKNKIGKKVSNLEEILKMPDEKFYEYLNLRNTIKNWNDFSQAKFPNKSFNDIKMLDLDQLHKSSYIKGNEFFDENNFKYIYLEKFEDNFRKFLEDCDRLELLNLNVDFNSFWGGFSNKLIESFDDETPKITKVIFGSDIHSSFMKLNKPDKKRDFTIDLNSIIKEEDSNLMEKIEANSQKFTQNLEKLINYLWYFTDLEDNKRNILFHPILRGMNPGIIKDLFNYKYEKFDSEDPIYNYYFSSICGANMHNLYVPFRSKYYGNSNYINNLPSSVSTLNFFETNINYVINQETNMNFLKLYGDKKFKNNGYIFNLNRNSNTISWPLFYSNLEKTKNKNFTIIHGFKESYKFIDEKIDGYLRKTGDFNYTSIDGFNLPFCFPRKIFIKNLYKYNDNNNNINNKSLQDNNNQVTNKYQKILLEESNKEKIKEPNNVNELFLDKLNMSSTYSPFNEYTKKFIHVVPQMLKKYESQTRKYLNTYDMGKYVEYKEKLENYYEFLDQYKQHDFYGGLGLSDSEEEEDDYEV